MLPLNLRKGGFMSTLYEQRVKRLREHVLRQQRKNETMGPTVSELKAKLDELGIEYDKRANRATLLSLLEAAQNENAGEDPEDDEGAE